MYRILVRNEYEYYFREVLLLQFDNRELYQEMQV